MELLTIQEAATWLRLSPFTLDRWRQLGKGPVFVKLGDRVLYRAIDLKEYIESQRRT